MDGSQLPAQDRPPGGSVVNPARPGGAGQYSTSSLDNDDDLKGPGGGHGMLNLQVAAGASSPTSLSWNMIEYIHNSSPAGIGGGSGSGGASAGPAGCSPAPSHQLRQGSGRFAPTNPRGVMDVVGPSGGREAEDVASIMHNELADLPGASFRTSGVHHLQQRQRPGSVVQTGGLQRSPQNFALALDNRAQLQSEGLNISDVGGTQLHAPTAASGTAHFAPLQAGSTSVFSLNSSLSGSSAVTPEDLIFEHLRHQQVARQGSALNLAATAELRRNYGGAVADISRPASATVPSTSQHRQGHPPASASDKGGLQSIASAGHGHRLLGLSQSYDPAGSLAAATAGPSPSAAGRPPLSAAARSVSVLDGVVPASQGRNRTVGASRRPRLCLNDSCRVDLSQDKAYYKRRKLCGTCIHSFSVVVRGREMRFCQQCSSLHPIGEFDGERRSCRKTLEKHKIRARRSRQSRSETGEDDLAAYNNEGGPANMTLPTAGVPEQDTPGRLPKYFGS